MLEGDDFVTNLMSNHAVSFWLWKRANKQRTSLPRKKDLNEKNSYFYKNEICYRNLVSGTKKHDVNSILSIFTYREIGKEKAIRWMYLAKQHGFLPKYINIVNSVNKGRLSFNLTRHTNNEWYVFLSITRFLHSEPSVVLNTLTMVDKGVDFFTSLIVASKIQLDNSNHHFIPGNWCHQYLNEIDNVLGKKIDMKEVVALKKFITTMHTIKIKHKHFSGFTCNAHMEDIYKKLTTKDSFRIKELSSKKYKAEAVKLLFKRE